MNLGKSIKIKRADENVLKNKMEQITNSSAWKYLKGVEYKDIKYQKPSFKFPLMAHNNKLNENEWNDLNFLLDMKYAWLSLISTKKIIENNFRSEIIEMHVNIVHDIVESFTNIIDIHKVDKINKSLYLTELQLVKDEDFILKKYKIECINSLKCDCSDFSTTRHAMNGIKRFKNINFCRHVFFVILGKLQDEFSMETVFDLQTPDDLKYLFEAKGNSVVQGKDVIGTIDKFEICGSCFMTVVKDHDYPGNTCFRCNLSPIRILNYFVSSLEMNKLPLEQVVSCQFDGNKWETWLETHEDIEEYLYGGNLVMSFLDEMLTNEATWSDVFYLFKGYSKLYDCCISFHGKTDNLKKDVLLAYESIQGAFTSIDVISSFKDFDGNLATRFKDGCRLSFTQSNESKDDTIFISWNINQEELKLDQLRNENEILLYHGTCGSYCLNWIEDCTWELKSGYTFGQDFNTTNESAFYLQNNFDSAKERGNSTKLNGNMVCVMVFTAKDSYKTSENYKELKGMEWRDAVTDFRQNKIPRKLRKTYCVEGPMVSNSTDIGKGKIPIESSRRDVQICIKNEKYFKYNFRFLGIALYG
eukprot:NODE_137_length_16306_cov_0.462640.p3 type:complete len:586 gc:universal NODE_137_length_16306_cov_0.462640:3540-1783(-)